ncbi:MAG: serine/threonine protein kinase [Candidatus Nezhaarchaeota archaeon]|nr:serine/threonine protein kinase [Candidatus Nezhaarchaeota archaeon]
MELAEVVRSLRRSDVKLLKLLSSASSRYRYVPFEYLYEKLNLSASSLEEKLSFLNKLGLVRRNVGQYVGFELKSIGMDALALYVLTERGVVEALGPKLGVGKEADVYEAITPSGEHVAIKFHRAGRRSFKHVRKARAYLSRVRGAVACVAPVVASLREFVALKRVVEVGVSAPTPIARFKHALVTSKIEGDLLQRTRALADPEGFFNELMRNVSTALKEAGVVHGDLSEYNIIVTPREEPLIIDWPQWLSVSHPSAIKLLARDLAQLCLFFRRRFGLSVDADEALRSIGVCV